MCLAVPVKVIEKLDEGTIKVDSNGVKFAASSLLVENLQVGDFVIVHAGFVIEKLTQEDAKDKIDLYQEYLDKIANENK